jgi:hypothetical protein
MNGVRLLAVGAIAALLPTLSRAQAFNFGGPGGNIPDIGTFSSDIAVGGTGLTVSSVERVTIFGFAHTWVGDMIVWFEKLGGPRILLFQRVLGDGTATFGDSSDLGGNYRFEDNGALQTFEQGAMGGGGTFVVPDGVAYRPARQADPNATSAGVNSVSETYSVFAKIPLDGTWRLTISDYAGGDVGAFSGWEFRGQAVPEPSSVLVVGALCVRALFRRSK